MNNNKTSLPFVLIFLLLIITGFVGFFVFAPPLVHSFLNPDYKPSNDDHQIAGIILGAIATIIGIIVPLHYSIVLDIIEKLKNASKTTNEDDKQWVALYILTSDILIFVTGMFGATVLLESMISFGSALNIIKFNERSKIVAIFYLLLVVSGVFTSLFKSIKKIRIDSYFSGPFIWYYLILIIISLISAFWMRSLIFIRKPCIVSLISLFILSFLYILWHFLKIPFTPISRIYKISIIK